MKPGKPTTFAVLPRPVAGGHCLVFALPGNPVSCLVTAHLLVSPAIRRLSGLPPGQCMHPQVCRHAPRNSHAPLRLLLHQKHNPKALLLSDSQQKYLVCGGGGGGVAGECVSSAAAENGPREARVSPLLDQMESKGRRSEQWWCFHCTFHRSTGKQCRGALCIHAPCVRL